MSDDFRLGTSPSDDDVNRANWIIDRQTARIEALEAEVKAYEEMARDATEPFVLRRRMKQRRKDKGEA